MCNHNCNQGRTCDCVANEEYASSTQAPTLHEEPAPKRLDEDDETDAFVLVAFLSFVIFIIVWSKK